MKTKERTLTCESDGRNQSGEAKSMAATKMRYQQPN